MSFQLTFLGYYSIKSLQLKKQTHSVKRRNWSHRERTHRRTAPDGQLSMDGNCGRPPADRAAVRLRRTALEDSLAIRRRTAAKADVRGIAGRGRGRPDA
jgi:hypothetical protein